MKRLKIAAAIILAFGGVWAYNSYKAPAILTPVQVFQQHADSVVKVRAYSRDGMFRHYFLTTIHSGHGSGAFISRHGHVLTAAHVVRGRGPLFQIELKNGRRYNASVLVALPDQDVAILQPLQAESTPYIRLADDPLVGSWVTAITIPGGHPHTITHGLVSNYTDNKFLVTDTVIHYGSSGGPLFDQYGRLVGVASGVLIDTTAFGAKTGFSVFASPSAYRSVVEEWAR